MAGQDISAVHTASDWLNANSGMVRGQSFSIANGAIVPSVKRPTTKHLDPKPNKKK